MYICIHSYIHISHTQTHTLTHTYMNTYRNLDAPIATGCCVRATAALQCNRGTTDSREYLNI